MRKGHVARRRWKEISHLNQVDEFSGEREKMRERKRKERRRKEE